MPIPIPPGSLPNHSPLPVAPQVLRDLVLLVVHEVAEHVLQARLGVVEGVLIGQLCPLAEKYLLRDRLDERMRARVCILIFTHGIRTG